MTPVFASAMSVMFVLAWVVGAGSACAGSNAGGDAQGVDTFLQSIYARYSAHGAPVDVDDAGAATIYESSLLALMREDQHGAGFGVMSAIDGLGDCVSSIGLGALWSASSPATGFGVAALLAFMSAAMLSLMRLRPASGNSRS